MILDEGPQKQKFEIIKTTKPGKTGVKTGVKTGFSHFLFFNATTRSVDNNKIA